MNGDQRFRVYNRTNHDIGVTLASGLSTNIRTGSFAVLSVNDILYVESICNRRKFFSAKDLVPVADDGKELTLEDIGGYTDEYAAENRHYSAEEIAAKLTKPYKAFEAWIKNIDDPVELHAIWEVGKDMDLTASKLKMLQNKIPNVNLLENE